MSAKKNTSRSHVTSDATTAPSESHLEVEHETADSLDKVALSEAHLGKAFNSAVGTAEVTLRVTKFVDVLSKRKGSIDYANAKNHESTAEASLGGGNYRVTLKSPTTPIKIEVKKGGPVAFRIRVEDKANKQKYFPVGIAFKRTVIADHHDITTAALRSFAAGGVHIINGDLHFNYDYASFPTKESASNKKTTCEFYIIIQQEDGGKIGIIDPGIPNAN